MYFVDYLSKGGGSCYYAYNEAGKLIGEQVEISTANGVLSREMERGYDAYGRNTSFKVKQGDVVEQALSYTYNSAGQVSAITADGKEFTYSYLPNAPQLIDSVMSPIHVVSNAYEAKRDILSSKTNSWKNKIDSPVISSYTYNVNNLGQRTSVFTEGEAFFNAPAPWVWNYDVLGQVIKANNYDYSYDSIGNRKTSGKDNSVLTNYTSNNLNQYSGINTVSPSYDNEGNLLSGLSKTASLPNRDTFSFVYNADNRPIAVKQGEQIIEEYEYDPMGRRIRVGNTIILYNGYNAVAEYDSNSHQLKTSYTWGLDLSNSTQGAGGVGGLLSVTDYTTQTPLISYPTYDGNGNISEYITEIDNGSISAHYEYDAFGNVIKKTGSKDYVYQFSTKPYDSLTGLNYYNFRLYDSVSGRWINRDPIQEQGGLNLYNFIGNNGVNLVDALGMRSMRVDMQEVKKGDDIIVTLEMKGDFEYWKDEVRSKVNMHGGSGYYFYEYRYKVLKKVPFKVVYKFRCKKNGGLNVFYDDLNNSAAPSGETFSFSLPVPIPADMGSLGVQTSTSYRYNFDGTNFDMDPLPGNEKGFILSLQLKVKLIESNIISTIGSFLGFSGASLTDSKDEEILDTLEGYINYACRCR